MHFKFVSNSRNKEDGCILQTKLHLLLSTFLGQWSPGTASLKSGHYYWTDTLEKGGYLCALYECWMQECESRKERSY